MLQKNKILSLLLLISATAALFLFPWTKKVEIFKTNDIKWEMLKQNKKTNVFAPEHFKFISKYKITPETKKLNGHKIKISGFFKKEKHGKHTDYILTETVTEVCFMCNHDMLYNFLKLIPDKDKIHIFDTIKNDKLITVSGIFEIDTSKNTNAVFILKNAKPYK